MAQFMIFGPDGHPALTKDGKTPLPGAEPIDGASTLIYDDGGWADAGETGYSNDGALSFCAGLGTGYTASCMGRSPTARNPADIEAERQEAERKAQQEAAEVAAAAEAQARAEADALAQAKAEAAAAAEQALAAEAQAQAEAEAAEARRIQLTQSIADRQLAKTDPAAWAKLQKQRAINASYDAEVAEAQALGLGAESVAALEELRAAELAALEPQAEPEQ